MIDLETFKAFVLKDLLQNTWAVLLAFFFGFFFGLLFVANYDPGIFQDEYERLQELDPDGRDGPSIFIEAEELFLYLFITSFLAYPLLYSLVIHKEIETKTIKSVATYPLSFHQFKLYKIASFTVLSGIVMFVLAVLPVSLALMVGGTFRMFLELVCLYLGLMLTMAVLALLAINLNDLLVTVFKVRAYFSNIIFGMLVFLSVVLTEFILIVILEAATDESYSYASKNKPWLLENLPALSPFHVISRTLDWYFNNSSGFDGYILLAGLAVVIGLTYYLRPRHSFDDWF